MTNLPKPKRLNYLPQPKEQQPRQPTSDQVFYNSGPWRRLRKQQIKIAPFCEVHLTKQELIDCTFGTPIDHLVPITEGGARLAMENLLTLCETCHSRKSALESKRGCLINTVTADGEKIPAEGERERLIEELAKYIG